MLSRPPPTNKPISVSLITIHSYKNVLAAVVVAIKENRQKARKITMNLCGSVSPFVLIVDLLEKDSCYKEVKTLEHYYKSASRLS